MQGLLLLPLMHFRLRRVQLQCVWKCTVLDPLRYTGWAGVIKLTGSTWTHKPTLTKATQPINLAEARVAIKVMGVMRKGLLQTKWLYLLSMVTSHWDKNFVDILHTINISKLQRGGKHQLKFVLQYWFEKPQLFNKNSFCFVSRNNTTLICFKLQ